MSDSRTWPKRPKWHHLESAQSYARRQCEAVGLPFDYAERGLTSRDQPYINRVWQDDDLAACTVEAAAGRSQGHYARLKRIAQPNPTHVYPARFLCRLCSAGERVEQIGHDRENWCLRHSGQMVWVGPGTAPETQVIFPYDATQAKAERRFRRLVADGQVDPRLHARVWEMVRDNARLSCPDRQTDDASLADEGRETRERALLYPEAVAVLDLLADESRVTHWRAQPPVDLRREISRAIPPMPAAIDVLVERIILWLRPQRRRSRPTRIDPLHVPLDIVDTPNIVELTAPYPHWIRANPHAIAEWDWDRNDPMRDPWDASGVSHKAAWICDEGHSWESSPFTRGHAMTRCPYCTGQRVWPGHTDLASTHPALAEEWDSTPGRNVGDPDHVGAKSRRRINWICRNGHRWAAQICTRAKLGTRCPYCIGARPIPGSTDLGTTAPDLAAQWGAKNTRTPQEVKSGSGYRASWVCDLGHVWTAVVRSRSKADTGCPVCANRTVLPGFNDLATLDPDLTSQWDESPGANIRTPRQLTIGSPYRASWRCHAGHTWRATVASRRRGSGCPCCCGRTAIPGETDLATLRPEIAAEWDTSNDLSPDQVTCLSGRKVTWRCSRGHRWSAIVASRSKGHGCPYCTGKRAIAGENDLATLRPDLASEWDVANNLPPDQVTCFSNRRAAWRCAHGHTWWAMIANRSKGTGCPQCHRPRKASARHSKS